MRATLGRLPGRGSALRSTHRVPQQHRHRGGTDTTDARRDPCGDFANGLVDVGQHALAFETLASANDNRAGLDHVRPYEARLAGGGDEDVRLPRDAGEV